MALIQWSMFHLYAFYRQKYIPLPNLVRIGQFVLSNDLPLNCRTSKNVTFSCPVFSTFLNNKIHLRHSKQVNVIKRPWLRKRVRPWKSGSAKFNETWWGHWPWWAITRSSFICLRSIFLSLFHWGSYFGVSEYKKTPIWELTFEYHYNKCRKLTAYIIVQDLCIKNLLLHGLWLWGI